MMNTIKETIDKLWDQRTKVQQAVHEQWLLLHDLQAKVEEMEAASDLKIAMRGAMAALSQNKTFPADIKAAKSFLRIALAEAKGKEVTP